MKKVTTNPKPIILNVVDKYLEFVAPTYGPAGHEVLIDEGYSVKSVDDGKIASQAFECKDELEQAVVKYIRETTDKTDKRVGDGTTTAAILMGSIVKELIPKSDEMILSKVSIDVPRESQKIRKAAIEAVAEIKKMAKKVKTEEELYKIAYNSFNNEEIARLISKALFEIGKDGVISVEDSKTMNTECEKVEGLEIESGYVSPYFVNSERGVELEDAAAFLVDGKIDTLSDVLVPVKKFVESGATKILVVAEDFSEEVISFFIINKMKGMINPLLIKSPGFGEYKKEQLRDLAAVLGTEVFNPKISKWEEVPMCTVDSVKSTKDTTVFLQKKTNKKILSARIAEIQRMLSETISQYDREKLEKRLAQLMGGVVVLKVGAYTEQEQKAIRPKVEDAVSATKVALYEGIVKGAGETLASIKTSSEVLNRVLKTPRLQLEKNGAHLLSKDVWDPAAVLIASLETAVSIALRLANITAISAVEIEKEKKHEF